MKLRLLISLITSFIIAFVIFNFSKKHLYENYSSSVQIKISDNLYSKLSVIEIPGFAWTITSNYNDYLIEKNNAYMSQIFLASEKKMISEGREYFLLNENENCKIYKKFNKLPVSVVHQGYNNNNRDYTNFITEINFILQDPKNINICNEEVLRMLNNSVIDSLTFHIKHMNNLLNFYYDDKKYYNSLLEYQIYKDEDQFNFQKLYKNYLRLQDIKTNFYKENYYRIHETKMTVKRVSPKTLYTYIFFIFLSLFIFLYFASSSSAAKYYKKISKYIQ